MSEENLISKLSKAMSEINSVGKDGQNDFQHYSFQSEGAIKAVVKKALSDNGLMVIPQYEIIKQYDRQGTKGKITHYVDVMGTFTITDGENEIVGKMAGSGQDTAEKAMVKAETTAQKYFYKQLFNISDQEEDPDSSDSSNGGRYMQTASAYKNNANNKNGNTSNRNQCSTQSVPSKLSTLKQRTSELLNEVAAAAGQSPKKVEGVVVETIHNEYQGASKMKPDEKIKTMIKVLENMKKQVTGKNSEEMTLEEVEQ